MVLLGASESTVSLFNKLEEEIGCQVQDQIAASQHSTVFRAYAEGLHAPVAIKLMDRRRLNPLVAEKCLPRELEIVDRVRHPHIVRCLALIEGAQQVAIVTELAGRSLLDLLMKSGRPLPERPDGSRLLRQLAEAVHYLHQRGLVHRDIKLENILLDSEGNAKLVDFGFARFMAPVERSTSFCGTRPYAAPELHLRKAYEGPPVDWYALGAVLFAVLVGKMPFVSDLAALSPHIVYPDSATPSTAARDLVRALLEPDPVRRAGYDECVHSTWLKDEPWTWTHKDIIYEAIK